VVVPEGATIPRAFERQNPRTALTACPVGSPLSVFLSMDALASELYYIAIEADRAGRTAVIEDQTVAIFTSMTTPRTDGPAYVSYRVDRVKSARDAIRLLDTV
jgi:hypothetical protein